MIRLLLLRHAKSAWDDPNLPDIDRPLAPRGKRAAEAMGKALVERDLVPDLILCSPSKRTRQTLRELRKTIPDEAKDRIVEGLYETPDGNYIRTIAEHGDQAKRLMVIGHNPTIQRTAVSLTGSGDAKLRSDMGLKYPTTALAVIDFDTDGWKAIDEGQGNLALFLRQRDLDIE